MEEVEGKGGQIERGSEGASKIIAQKPKKRGLASEKKLGLGKSLTIVVPH